MQMATKIHLSVGVAFQLFGDNSELAAQRQPRALHKNGGGA
jgi:hypothetical protein